MVAWRSKVNGTVRAVAMVAVLVSAVTGLSLSGAVPAGAAGPPVVRSLAPSSGSGAGGTIVVISGIRFANPVTSVQFGGAAVFFARLSGQSIEALAPSHAAGAVDVTVTDGAGTSVANPGDVFTFQPSTPPPVGPAITAVSPSSGLVLGGTRVTIDGSGLSGATAVLFGSTPAVITSNTSTFVTVDTPAEAAGTVDITVTTPTGTTPLTPADRFSFLATVPAAPLNVVAVTQGSSSAVVSWTPPDDGGSPIVSNAITTYEGTTPVGVTTVGPVDSAVVSRLAIGTAYRFSVTAANAVGPGPESHKSVSLVAASLPFGAPAGYRLVTSAGAVLTDGGESTLGSASSLALSHPIVGEASTPDGLGYWLVASDGGVFAFGDARFYGSMGGHRLNAPIVGMAVAPKGQGYWLVASDGGVFTFGDALFHGSTGGTRLNAPIVGMARDVRDGGYWLVARDGGIFSFGGATFDGSTGGHLLNAPIIGMAVDAASNGYWLVARDGGVFSFGGAAFHGSTGGLHLRAPIVAVAADPDTDGYWLAASDGGVFAFDAPFEGSQAGKPLAAPVVGIDS